MATQGRTEIELKGQYEDKTKLGQAAGPIGGRPPGGCSYFFLGGTTASLNAFAKRNLTTVLAGILIASPV